MCAKYCVDMMDPLEGDPTGCLEPACYGTEEKPRFVSVRKTCKDMWGMYYDCLLKTKLCHDERWMFWLMTRGEENEECMKCHQQVLLYVTDDTGAAQVEDTKQPEPWTLDVSLLVTVLLVPLCVVVVVGLVVYYVRHVGMPVQPFVPKQLPTGSLPEDGIPKPYKGSAPILAKEDKIGGQYGPIMANMGKGGGMNFTVPGKRTHNVIKPNAQVMYAYPAPQKVKWSQDDPRLPNNLAQEYVRQKTLEERRNIARDQEKETKLRAFEALMQQTYRSLETEAVTNDQTVATLQQSASSVAQSAAN